MTLVNHNQGIIHKILNLYTPNDYAQEDLKQDILAEAWKSYSSFRGEAKFSTWLYRIAKNTAITKLRKLGSAIKTVSFDNPFYQIIAESRADEDHGMMRSLEMVHAVRLRYVFGCLSDRDRELIVLYASGYSYDEMEEMLGENSNNLRVRVNRIKERLNKHFTNRPLSIYE